MRTHQELIEEVYNNMSFSGEFKSYAKLRSTLQVEQQFRLDALGMSNTDGIYFISYNDLLKKPKVEADSVLVAKCKRGITFLYSSLSKALSKTYQLDAEEIRQIIFAVADRHSQNLGC